MSYYGSTPKHPEIEVGSDFVVVRDKHHARTAQILRTDVDADGTRRLTLDRLLGRYSGCYVERTAETPSGERKWQASGAFTTELTWHAQPQAANETPPDDTTEAHAPSREWCALTEAKTAAVDALVHSERELTE